MEWQNVVFHQGNEELQRFIEIGVLAAKAGVPIHFHVEGVRGTGKTTLIRAAKSRLPQLERVKDCRYNCEAGSPHCPEHQSLTGLESEVVDTPFLEISHSAKVGTVVGSIDLDKLTSVHNPAAAILPGTLPRAHRGIVFVDEINRLADTSPALVDVLLDVMGTKPGRVQIEETGLPTVEMPVNLNVWAASNPDEEPGPLQEIRRQLADRFDFVVRIERPDQPEVIRSIMNASAQNMAISLEAEKQPLSDLSLITLDEQAEDFLSNLYIRYRLESIRGIQAARLGALLHAALYGRRIAGFSDLAAILPAALRHRIEAPKLQEIAAALGEQVVSEQKKATSPAKAKKDPAKDRGPQRYPALWRGLWQRLSKKQNQSSGKTVAVNTPQEEKQDVTQQNEEKKTANVLTNQGETNN
ncbi:ATP-binding protein [Dethiobacter alkaliphilus]|uniref:Mg-protoporphyrin IX chelatase n=1 Tax=Dethiobacter alkaliphilus AHT 1 TaxID=555088 RepID=C0GKG2_DETAL|nr:ATP-binding protein [Dethiobacter alkaliphilus]EEG76205.1 magnesium chelatase ChlI subunit [Dethiobacter alkaliphilus AHT 1]